MLLESILSQDLSVTELTLYQKYSKSRPFGQSSYTMYIYKSMSMCVRHVIWNYSKSGPFGHWTYYVLGNILSQDLSVTELTLYQKIF